MKPPRIGVIGARRARQGLGPFVARDLRAAGAEVPCFLVSRVGNVETARAQLAEAGAIDVRGYVDLREMLGEGLDALAICSPHETHLEYLEAAIRAGLHTLCEKPLLWGVDDFSATAARIVGSFDARGLLLRENCQWGYMLPAFARLFPGALDRLPQRFAMRLQPAGRGLRMLADALPHPLSLLQLLAPGRRPHLRDVRFSSTNPRSDSLRVDFIYCSGDALIDVEVELDRSDAHPRRVWLEVDGRRAERVVSPGDYALSLRGETGTVPLDDPLTSLVGDFVRELQGARPGRPASADEIVDRMTLLGEVVRAWRREAP